MPTTRSPCNTRFKDTILLCILLVVPWVEIFYNYQWRDSGDPQKCGALLHQGKWLDPPSESAMDHQSSFQKWQPPGCMIHDHKAKDIEKCFRGERITIAGDSTTRQIYWELAKKLDYELAENEIKLYIKSEEQHEDHRFDSSGVTLQFIWDPYLNSSALDYELASFRSNPDSPTTRGSAALLLLGAPGLWYARYGKENHFRSFRDAIDRVIPYMDHTPVEAPGSRDRSHHSAAPTRPNLLLLAPVQVPHYASLSPPREATITSEKIDQMNDYLQQVSAYSKADLVWSYSSMTWGQPSAYEHSGLHVLDNIAQRKADVLLNLRCNAAAMSDGYPFNRTCCSNYQGSTIIQNFLYLAALLVQGWVAIGWRFEGAFSWPYSPSSGIWKASRSILLVLWYAFTADRTQWFEKVHKQFVRSEWALAVAFIMIVGLLSFRRTQIPTRTEKLGADEVNDLGFLPRAQAEEWKGWMQAVILVYHYTDASKSLPIYEFIRVLVGAYLFMTGYGHAYYLLSRKDYSLRRVVSVLFKLNFLTATLTYVMGTDFLFYYFPSLVSFWFAVIYGVLRLNYRRNNNLGFLFGKIVLSAVLTTLLINGSVLESAAGMLRRIAWVSWNMTEWKFRLSLDMYIVYVGMIVAILHHRFSLLQSGTRRVSSPVDLFLRLCSKYDREFQLFKVLAAIVLAPCFTSLARRFSSKPHYNEWQPYISWMPILCYVTLRNSHVALRNHHSVIFAWLGRMSLETFVLQYHIWLAADTKGLLRLGLFDPHIEIVFLTILFLWISWHTEKATQTLTSFIVDGGVRFREPMSPVTDSVTVNDNICSVRVRGDANGSSIEAEKKELTEIPFSNEPIWVAARVWRLLAQDLRGRLFAILVLLWMGNLIYY